MVALDGFIAQLPSDLVFNTDESKAVAWLAIEPADHPWPSIPGKEVSAGPFSMVWTGTEVGSVRSEQWCLRFPRLAGATRQNAVTIYLLAMTAPSGRPTVRFLLFLRNLGAAEWRPPFFTASQTC